jgi:hypothetical protein
VLVSNNRYCHPADGVFDTNILLFCPSFLQKWLRYRARWRAHINYIIVYAAPHPWTGFAVTKLKPRKLILRAFSDFPRKLVPPENYPSYGITISHILAILLSISSIVLIFFSLDYNYLSDVTVPLLIEVIQTFKNLEELSWVILLVLIVSTCLYILPVSYYRILVVCLFVTESRQKWCDPTIQEAISLDLTVEH